MTEKEAIKAIRKEIDSFCESSEIDCFNSDCDNCKIIVVFEKAIKALEKQIPKKPYDVDTECKTFDCPECLSKLCADEDVRNCGYCCVCGQALDWSEEVCGS